LKAVILYHGVCADGFTAAYLMHKALVASAQYTDIHCIAADYGDDVPDVINEHVDLFILDFSYPRGTLVSLSMQANSIVVLDHHTTAEEALSDLPFCMFCPGNCASEMTYDYINAWEANPGCTVVDIISKVVRESKDCYPKLVQYVADRDLWHWGLPSSKAASAMIQSIDKSLKEWDVLFWSFENILSAMLDQGEAILRYQNQLVRRIASLAIPVKIHGVDKTVLAVNSAVLQSEIGHVLAQKVDVGLIIYQNKKGEIVNSLRSEGDVDVAAIAKMFPGGGGHKNAAGCTTPGVIFLPVVAP